MAQRKMLRLLPSSAPRWLTGPIVGVLAGLGVTPNMVSVAGLAGNIGAAVLAGYGEFLLAGVAVLAASSLDFIDGALARATGKATPFGSVFDAVLDRVSEAAVLFGLLVYFSDRGGREEELLIFAAVVASFLVSYTKARVEVAGEKMSDGWFSRPERVLLLSAGLIVDQVTLMLWVLAVAAGVTALQRLFLAWLRLSKAER